MRPANQARPEAFYARVPILRGIVRRVQHKFQKWEFWKEFNSFKSLAATLEPRFNLGWSDRFPCLGDRTPDTPFDHHYVLHTAWAARRLAQIKPTRHVDISSNLFFVAACSTFVPIDFYDYRPANLKLDNVECRRGDLMALPFADASVPSLSCMHVVEHIGLGRYGDPLDPEGDLKAMRELARVVSIGGSLLYVTPVGRPRIQFNAHRIYSYEQIVSAFPGYELREFALIPDVNNGGWITNATPEQVNAQKYGCGCFWFQRRG